MQLLKHKKIFGVISLLLLGLSPILARTSTEEAEARDKAKEQLNQKMAELEAQLQAAEASKPPGTESNSASAPEITNPAEKTAADITAQNELAEKQAAEAKAIAEIQAKHDAEVETEVRAAQARSEAERAAAKAKAQAIVVKPEITQPEKTVAPVLAMPTKRQAEAIEEARQQMRQKMVELDNQSMAQPQAVKSAPPVVKTPAPTATAEALGVNPKPAKPVVISKPPPQPVVSQPEVVKPLPKVDSEQIAQARRAMEQKMNELSVDAKFPASPLPTAAISATAKKESRERSEAEKQALKAATYKKAPPALSVTALMEAPPAAVSAAKQQRLNDLLARYKDNNITPGEYHEQRAKILAEP